MKVYKNPFVSYPCYFVKTGAGWSARGEASKSKGYDVELHNGKWTCRDGCYYNDSAQKTPAVRKNARGSVTMIQSSMS